eukprot:COSAG04_NODE_135_length_23774_cov_40.993918_14_plen_45_part_00
MTPMASSIAANIASRRSGPPAKGPEPEPEPEPKPEPEPEPETEG